MIPYYMVMEHLALVSEMLVGRQPIRYNRHKNRCYIDLDWNSVKAGEYLLIEAYEVVDPDVYSDVWGDRWLQNYTAAKIKYQWGSHLTKFLNQPMTGGVQFNGERILSDAEEEIKRLEDEMIYTYSLPVTDFFG